MTKSGTISVHTPTELDENGRSFATSSNGQFTAFWEDNWVFGKAHGEAGVISTVTRRELFQTKLQRPVGAIACNDGSIIALDVFEHRGEAVSSLTKHDPAGNRIWEFSLPASVDEVAMDEREAFLLLATDRSRYYMITALTAAICWERFIEPVGVSMRPCFRSGSEALEVTKALNASPIVLEISGGEPAPQYRQLLAEQQAVQVEFAQEQHEQAIAAGKYYAILPEIEDELKQLTPSWGKINELLQLVGDNPSEVPEYALAKIWRFRGEAYLEIGNLEAGLKCLERALSIDPKVGVKKRVSSLKSQLGLS